MRNKNFRCSNLKYHSKKLLVQVYETKIRKGKGMHQDEIQLRPIKIIEGNSCLKSLNQNFLQ